MEAKETLEDISDQAPAKLPMLLSPTILNRFYRSLRHFIGFNSRISMSMKLYTALWPAIMRENRSIQDTLDDFTDNEFI